MFRTDFTRPIKREIVFEMLEKWGLQKEALRREVNTNGRNSQY
jgi:hypothetical protein